MFALSPNQLSKLAAVGSLVVLSVFGLPVHADELAQNLGPVGPHEPILTTIGSKRVIAFYSAEGGQCTLDAVVWNTTDAEAESAARFRVRLAPRQTIHVDSPDNKSLSLQCGDKAETLEISDPVKFIATGAAQ